MQDGDLRSSPLVDFMIVEGYMITRGMSDTLGPHEVGDNMHTVTITSKLATVKYHDEASSQRRGSQKKRWEVTRRGQTRRRDSE